MMIRMSSRMGTTFHIPEVQKDFPKGITFMSIIGHIGDDSSKKRESTELGVFSWMKRIDMMVETSLMIGISMSLEKDKDRYEHREREDESSRFNHKLDILDFKGKMPPNNFLDQLSTMEWIFDYYDPPEHKKMKLVAIKI